MNWNQAIQDSLRWLAVATPITSAGSLLAALLCIRFTRWGRQFWQISGPYLSPKRSWRPLLVLLVLLVLALFGVRINVLFSFWYNGFYSALQAMDQKGFWFYVGLFAILAAIHVLRTVFNAYLTQALSIHWRTALNERLVGDWLDGSAYYRRLFLQDSADNPDQRIESDITSFVSNTLDLAFGTISSLVSLGSFTLILWGLSGPPLTIAGVELPRAMVFIVYAYVLVCTLIAFRLGQPLIRLNFLSEKFVANFRYALVRVREYAESIAFYRGVAVETRVLADRFNEVIGNAWALLYRSLKFDAFNLTASQIAVVFPLLLQAPRFFAGAIKLGDVMQTAQAFGQVRVRCHSFVPPTTALPPTAPPWSV